MSLLSKLDKKNLTNIADILVEYDELLDGWKARVEINGKNIEQAHIEQASWLSRYDEIKVQLKTLVDFLDMKVNQVRGRTMAMILKTSNEIHNERTRERLIDNDPDFIRMQTIYLEVKELYNLANSIVEQLKQRGYMLTNIVKIRTAELENITLYLD